MTPKDVENLGRGLELRALLASGAAGNDLVRIVTALADEVERFDAIVLSRRRVLERLDLDNDQLDRQAERVSVEAAQVVACARQTLDQLSRLAAPVESLALQPANRRQPGGLSPRWRED